MALSFVEEWSRPDLHRMLSVVQEPSSRHVLCTLLQNMEGQFNNVEYTQKHSNGRYYGSFPCAQSLNGKLRRMYFHNKAVDIDMSNCYCTILGQLAVKHGQDVPYLSAYNLDPKHYQRELAFAVGDAGDNGKLYFICLLHGGDLRLSDIEGHLSACYLQAEAIYPFARGLRMELECLFSKLALVYGDVTAKARSLADECSSSNVQGRFFYLLLSVIENSCLMALRTAATDDGRVVIGLWFDGLMIWHDEEDEEKNPIDLHQYEDAIRTSTGYDMKLAFKSLEPKADDLEWLSRSALYVNESLILNREYKDSVRVEPFRDFDDGLISWLLVSAPMGSGKTYQMMAYIERLFTKNPNTRILLPTSRIIQSVLYHSLLSKITIRGGPLPVTLYRDANFLKKAQFGPVVVICEFESLHLLLKPSDSNLNGECMAFTSVILDETGGLMSTLISPTNGFNLVPNYTAFCFIVKSAREVLCTCADMFLTPVVPEFVLGLVDQRKVKAIVYQRRIVDRKYIIYPENVSLVDWQTAMWSAIRRRLEDDTCARVALLTRTKIAVDSFLHQVKDVFEAEGDVASKFIVVTRDTTQTEMEAFSDMDSVFENKIGIVASPKITSATDIQHVHSVFMDIRGVDGASVRSLGQASGRVRKIFSDEVHVLQPYYKPAPLPPEPTKQECVELIRRREASRYQTMSAFKSEVESQTRVVAGYEDFGPTAVISIRSPTDSNLVNLVANITREAKLSQRQFFVSQFHNWILSKGFELEFAERDVDGPSDEALSLQAEAKLAMKAARLAVKEAYADMEKRVFDELKIECTSLGDIDRAFAQMKTLQAKDAGLSSEQTVRLMMLAALAKYPHFYNEIELDQVRYTMKNSSILYAASACNLLSPVQIRDLDVVNASKAPLLADAGVLSRTIEVVTSLISLGGGAGIVSTEDYPIDVDSYLLDGNIRRFKELMGQARDSLKNIASSTLRKSRAVKEDRKMVKGELRSVLNRLGIKLDPECSRGCSKYRVVPHDEVKRLLEHISFRSLDPSSDSGSDTLRELIIREKAYNKLLDSIQQSETARDARRKLGGRPAKRQKRR
jgi:hypothetical protein